MKKTIKYLALLFTLTILLSSFVLASSLDVKVTSSKELAFTILSDDLGWQTSRIEIFNDKNSLMYEFEDSIYFTNEPSFQLLTCPKCTQGNYSVVAKINQTTLISSFNIPKTSFDWFWIIMILLLIGLVILALFTLKHESLKKNSKKSVKKKQVKKK